MGRFLEGSRHLLRQTRGRNPPGSLKSRADQSSQISARAQRALVNYSSGRLIDRMDVCAPVIGNALNSDVRAFKELRRVDKLVLVYGHAGGRTPAQLGNDVVT